MITNNDAIVTLRSVLPASKKIFYQVNGEALQNGQVLWMFRYFVAKADDLILVTPLITAILGYKVSDTELLRIRDIADLDKVLSALQNRIQQILPEDGILLLDISAGTEVIEVALLGEHGVAVPEVPTLEIVTADV